MDHIAKHYPCVKFFDAATNCSSTTPAHDTKWLIDSATSHNITGDLANLFVHSKYDDINEVVIGDG